MSLFNPLKTKCKTCFRYCIEGEIVADLCANCWYDRSESMRKKFRISNFQSNGHPECWQCHQPIYLGGYLTWVIDAKSFAYFCVPCSDKKHRTDSQYHKTKFHYENKL